MSRTQDEVFFDTFMAIIGALVLFTVAMIALANAISVETVGQSKKSDPQLLAATRARIEPIGQVVVAGEAAPVADQLLAAATPAVQPPPATQPQPAAQTTGAAKSGEEVYQMACVACHAAGIAGAPRVGDVAAWTPRIAQGMETLTSNAINGYTGETGFMPARGGLTSLSDDEVIAAIEYMLEKSQ